MIALLSPAKKLNFESPSPTDRVTEPAFLEKAEYLVKKLKKKSPGQLRKMMGISQDLAQLNTERFQHWSAQPQNGTAKQAMFAFAGDVYVGLNADNFSASAVDYAQDHLRILSGLYGVLRPLDAIMPYRLEMGTDWAITGKIKNLREYWKTDVTQTLIDDIDTARAGFVLNLASKEYARAVDWKKVHVPVIEPIFKEERGGEFKMISFFAKKARGLMAAFAVENRIERAEDLKTFDAEGYSWNERLSNIENNQWVFTRKTK